MTHAIYKTYTKYGGLIYVVLTHGQANHLNSDADLKNLDFVEQESGVKQERDLQKSGEQARSNMDLKAMDLIDKGEERSHDLLKEYLKGKKE